MTAQTLSPSELGITQAEHKALLEIRDLFAAGTFKHDPDFDLDKPDGFNMAETESTSECGTTCCIGGWMWHAMNRDRTTRATTANNYVNAVCSDALTDLFFPTTAEIAWEDITPGAALVAINQFLATGEVDWDAACGMHHAVEVARQSNVLPLA